MAVKGKNRKQKRTRTRTQKSSLRRTRINRKTRSRRMRGGNYNRDVTTRTLENTPTKPLNKFVVSVPGYGVMSGASYAKLMERIDRDGSDLYD